MESQAFLACLALMAKEEFRVNRGRGARWVGRAFRGTLGREGHLDQMESQATWVPPVRTESLDLSVIWGLWENWALPALLDSRGFLEILENQD